MADNIEKIHESLMNDSLAKNAARILSTKQVIEQYESQVKLFQELPTTLKKAVLVPIGTKGFLRGHIVHTNEVYHKVGCGYVIKRTAKQSIEYCERMLAETTNFLTKLQQEENWLTNQLNITTHENPFASKDCIEIVENYDEASEMEWRQKHRENLKKWKQDEAKEREAIQNETSDKDVFSRLDELEILEELEQFTSNMKNLHLDETPSGNSHNIESNTEPLEQIEQENTKKSIESESAKNIESPEENIVDNTKKYLDFVELRKLNENLENLHNNQSTKNVVDANTNNNLDVNTRKLEIEGELEKSRQTKTIIKTDVDLMNRLDELEKQENLLEEMEILTNTEEIVNNDASTITTTELVLQNDAAASKKCTIRFNEQVRTNYYISTKAVSDDGETESVKDTKLNEFKTGTATEDEPVTLYIYFSHTQDDLIEKPTVDEDKLEVGMLKPSDIYDLPYRPKSILKNKNRLFDEPQHTGEHIPEPITSYPHHRKKDRGRDRWVCYDTFSSVKNGNDSDQENANVVQVPPPPPAPLTEVKEKTDFNHSSGVGVVASTTVGTPPKKRQSRFLVSRALITKK